MSGRVIAGDDFRPLSGAFADDNDRTMSHNEIHSRELYEQPAAVEVAELPVECIGPFLARAFEEVVGALVRHGAGPAGLPFARYHRIGHRWFRVEAGFPAFRAVPESEAVRAVTLPGGTAAVTTHTGPYDEMEPAYEAISAWIAERGEPAGDAWEVYHTDPQENPNPASWRTDIIAPYRDSST